MDTIVQNRIWTDEDLHALPNDGNKYGVMKGVLIMSPTGIEHEYIGVRLISSLDSFVREHKLGIVVGSSAGFWMKNRDFLSPDVSFIGRERLKGDKRPPKKFFNGAPDLAVEVLSPSDTVEMLHDKIIDYFENGSRLVWVVNPEEKVVLIYHSPQPDQLLREGDAISGEDVIPGFSTPVSDLFSDLDL
jgi:Uma2 family endonuclease